MAENSQTSTDSIEWQTSAWCNLLLANIHATNAHWEVTERARLLLTAGLGLPRVLDALKLTAEEWDDRVRAHDEHKAENRAAADARESARIAEANARPELVG